MQYFAVDRTTVFIFFVSYISPLKIQFIMIQFIMKSNMIENEIMNRIGKFFNELTLFVKIENSK